MEVTCQIAPDRVDVIRGSTLGIGLEVTEFRNKGWSLKSNKVLLFGIGSASPSEVDRSVVGCCDQLHAVLSHNRWHCGEVRVENSGEHFLLLWVEFRGSDSDGCSDLGLWFTRPLNIVWAFV